MYLVFLQNAWFKKPLTTLVNETGPRFPSKRVPLKEWSPPWRRIWLYATAVCHSGRRLRWLLGEDCFERGDIKFEDASPKVSYGDSAGKFPADPKWITAILADYRPDVVFSCGTIATDALVKLWRGPLVGVPHPAARLLPRDLYSAAGKLGMAPGFRDRVMFSMSKDGWTSINLAELYG